MNLIRVARACISRATRQATCQSCSAEFSSRRASPRHCASRICAPAHSYGTAPSPSPLPAGSDPAEQRSPPTQRVVRLVDEITQLTLLEVSDLTQLIKKRLGLPDMPMGMPMGMPMAMAPGPQQAVPAAAAEVPQVEKTVFDVKLDKIADSSARLKVIKEVRAVTGLGLKESKDLVEKLPSIVKKQVSKEEAESIIEKLRAAGGDCSMD